MLLLEPHQRRWKPIQRPLFNNEKNPNIKGPNKIDGFFIICYRVLRHSAFEKSSAHTKSSGVIHAVHYPNFQAGPARTIIS